LKKRNKNNLCGTWIHGYSEFVFNHSLACSLSPSLSLVLVLMKGLQKSPVYFEPEKKEIKKKQLRLARPTSEDTVIRKKKEG